MIVSIRIGKKKGYTPVFDTSEMNKLEFINITDLRTISMVSKNEKISNSYSCWSNKGLGWNYLDGTKKRTKEDCEKNPNVLR